MMAWLLKRQLVGVSKFRLLQVHISKYVGQQSFWLKEIAILSRGQGMSFYGSSCCIQRLKSKSLAFDLCCKELVLRKGINIGYRSFHTTQPRHVLSASAVFCIKAAVNVGSLFMGRWFRKWWGKKSKEEKAKMIDFIFHKNKWNILGTLGVMILGSLLFYFEHLEINPITKRQRFVMYNIEEMKSRVDPSDALKENFISKMLPNDHPLHHRIAKVMLRVMAANREEILKTGITNWTIYIIDAPNVVNAMVTPNGSVFVFSGVEKVFHSDDELGCLLAHEISHIILNHHGETATSFWYMLPLNAVIIATIWALLPDFAALLAQIAGLFAAEVLFLLPSTRLRETEADEVGLLLGAKACLDVRVMSLVWAKMAAKFNLELPGGEYPEIIATHPQSKTRQAKLEKLIPKAIILRESCKCKPLSPVDPRDSFESWRKQLELEYRQKEVEQINERKSSEVKIS